MKTTIFILAMTLTQQIFANVGDAPAYVGSPQERGNLERALRSRAISTSATDASVSCLNVITIPTGGRIGSATAGTCTVNGLKVFACINNMTGETATAQTQQINITVESNLRKLIDSACTGG